MSRAHPPRSRDLPGTRSNQLVGAAHTFVVDAGDHLVRHTPARPDYWSGNQLVLDRPPCTLDDPPERARAALAGWIERAAERPELARVTRHTLAWESLDPRPLAPEALLPGTSYTIDAVLRLAQVPSLAEPPAGMVFRPVVRDSDWEAIAALIIEDSPELRSYAGFVRWTYRELRAAFARSQSTWWTAWHGAELIGSLGLFEAAELRRFQELQTHAAYRRRGVASTLIRLAIAHDDVGEPARSTYIVAAAGEPPERLYRNLGFEACSWVHTIRVPRTP